MSICDFKCWFTPGGEILDIEVARNCDGEHMQVYRPQVNKFDYRITQLNSSESQNMDIIHNIKRYRNLYTKPDVNFQFGQRLRVDNEIRQIQDIYKPRDHRGIIHHQKLLIFNINQGDLSQITIT